MLVYQLLLLGGYWYSHVLAMRWKLRWQAGIHLVLLAITALWLIGTSFIWGSPLLPGASWKFLASGNPILGLVGSLAAVHRPAVFSALDHRPSAAELVCKGQCG